MQCPSCGAHYKKRTLKCPECGAFRNKNTAATSREPDLDQITAVPQRPLPKPKQKAPVTRTPSLIEFPGVVKPSIPEWRKELGERVREVQERRAREATPEVAEIAPTSFESTPRIASPLELLPQAELPPMNPLVVAALQRIERANAQSNFSGNAAVATAVDYDQQFDLEAHTADLCEAGAATIANEEPQNLPSSPERVHNLAVVPTPAPKTEAPELRIKPKRLIRDNDPALNYLDSIPTAALVDQSQRHSAPILYRLLGSILDLGVVCILSLPMLALVKLTDLAWHDVRVIAFVAGTLLVVGFLYQTISTALTGRTLGMKPFSLRVVDARTGLIPTGKQSAGRAMVYILSLASAGIALAYTFFDSDKHTAHDRFSRTTVVRV
jgi:uncharacterized RDD family membrane protein YckC